MKDLLLGVIISDVRFWPMLEKYELNCLAMISLSEINLKSRGSLFLFLRFI